jgi:peptide deformylase
MLYHYRQNHRKERENLMSLKIVQLGESVLRQPARRLSIEEIRSAPIQQLIEEMRETMYAAPGVGLAAPQIGEPLQLAVIEDRADYLKGVPEELLAERERSAVPFQVIINPEISLAGKAEATFFEGCLSLSGFTALVPRALEVQVKCLNQHGEPLVINARGWYARILQHEIDHLRGTVYIDRMLSRSFMSMDNYQAHWMGLSVNHICEKLDAFASPANLQALQ